MSNVTKFYIVRHGETDWNVINKVQGHTDIPLNNNGEKQAKELKKKLDQIKFDKVLSSDLIRARRTAEIITEEKELEIRATKLLRERSFGKNEGSEREEYTKHFTNWEKLSENEKWNFVIADEESHEKASTRFITLLRETALAYPGKTILITTHGGIMRSFLIKLGFGDFDTLGRIGNCGYLVLELDGIDFFVKETYGIEPWKKII